MHLTEISQALIERRARAATKNPADWPGLERTQRLLDAAQVLIDDALASGGEGHTNGTEG